MSLMSDICTVVEYLKVNYQCILLLFALDEQGMLASKQHLVQSDIYLMED